MEVGLDLAFSHTRIFIVVAILVAMALSVPAAEVKYKLTASDWKRDDYFGHTVAVDSNTAAISINPSNNKYNDKDNALYVFSKANGGWTEQAKLTPSDPSFNFGEALAVDKDTVIAGDPSQDGGAQEAGAAYVFHRSQGEWHQQAEFTSSNPEKLGRFGESVDLEGDTAIVGASGEDDAAGAEAAGAAYVFHRSEGEWAQTARLTIDNASKGDYSAGRVAVDGDTVLVTNSVEDAGAENAGAVYVFSRSEVGGWSEKMQLTPQDQKYENYFGESLAVDGGTALIGSSEGFYVFTESGGRWTEQTIIPLPESGFNDLVSLHGDVAILGDDDDDESESAYLYSRGDSGWTMRDRVTSPESGSDQEFGDSVAITSGTALVGAPGYSRDQGAAFVVDLNKAPTAAFDIICNGLACRADGSPSSDPDGSIQSYEWDWGDGFRQETGVSPSLTYRSAGTYTVTLTVEDDQGATDSIDKEIQVTESSRDETRGQGPPSDSEVQPGAGLAGFVIAVGAALILWTKD